MLVSPALQVDLWRIEFSVPSADTGYLPIAARELKTKMKSREALWEAAGVPADQVRGGIERRRRVRRREHETRGRKRLSLKEEVNYWNVKQKTHASYHCEHIPLDD